MNRCLGWTTTGLGQYHDDVINSDQISDPVFTAAFEPVKDLLEQQIQDGLHPGAQLSVAIDGELVADFAVGERVVDSGVALTNNSVMPLFSSAKPITAVALGVLADSGRLNFDDPVATHIPEFAANGKSSIQIKHLMNHTSGLADDALADGGNNRQEVISRLSGSATIEGWVSGERSAYIPTAGWHVLGEIIERASGSSYESFVQDFILNPIGMNSTFSNVDPNTAETLGERLGVMHDSRRQPMTVSAAYTPERLGRFVRPGSSFHGPAQDMVKFYSMLLNDGVALTGEQIIAEGTLTTLITRQHEGLLDETFGVVMDRGLGFFIDSQRHSPAVPYGYGTPASAVTFGHGGKESSTGFADPERGLAVSLVFNGMPGEPKHDRRLKQVLAVVYEAVDSLE
ncbi:serine hydrolase [Candidatus Lucifugimonas marina]|uniref:Serine hydrolase n=1 Tax=Candidatus Lucifugimonas marina TaxID=3038979 RepID=A0AAJ6CVG3_9CHLR|nr:serine hydrolase [SAR202 cluster bacterium JH702]MDG0870223.1 serine hydrolase [SAR202 cluster bacterium JH639]WFG36213.1 serine hydrolase [SAR202 cluster bacterium JH545]WFG40159.1 serine hydrolase [SAR202 cluster bacterium JH1073]